MLYGIAAMLLLTGLMFSDLKSRTIPVWPAALLAAGSVLAHLLQRDLPAAEVLTGMLPGLFLLLVSMLFRSSIGTGDGIVIAACGLAIGFSAEFTSLVTALVLCAAFSAILLIRKKASRKDSIPFLPFLAAGHALFLIVQHLS